MPTGTNHCKTTEESLVQGLEQLIDASSTTPTNAYQSIAQRIKEPTFRKGLFDYLDSVIRRDRAFVQQAATRIKNYRFNNQIFKRNIIYGN